MADPGILMFFAQKQKTSGKLLWPALWLESRANVLGSGSSAEVLFYFTHDQQRISEKLGLDFLQMLPFTHKQGSVSYSVWTRSQQQPLLQIVQVRGSVAGRGRIMQSYLFSSC